MVIDASKVARVVCGINGLNIEIDNQMTPQLLQLHVLMQLKIFLCPWQNKLFI
jgi:hypothetical protein